MLGQYLQPHVFQHRQRVGKRDRRAVAEQLEAQTVTLFSRAVQRQADVVGVLEAGRSFHVGGRNVGADLLDVAARQRTAEAIGELDALFLAVLVYQQIAKFVVPVAHDLRDFRFKFRDVVARLVAELGADHQVQTRQRGFAKLDRRIDALAVKRALEQGLDALAHIGVETIARNEHQAGEEATVLVTTHEQARARLALQLQDPGRGGEQFVLAGLEQFVARQRFQDVTKVLAGMRIPAQSRPRQHRIVLAPNQRNFPRSPCVGTRGVQAEEALFADRHAVVVEPKHADVVHVSWTMHACARVGLGQDDRIQRTGLRQVPGRQGFQRALRHRAFGLAQDAETGTFHRLQHFLATDSGDAVFAIAKEGEMVAGDPAQELLSLGDAFSVYRCISLVQIGGNFKHLVAHRPPVAVACCDVSQRCAHATAPDARARPARRRGRPRNASTIRFRPCRRLRRTGPGYDRPGSRSTL